MGFSVFMVSLFFQCPETRVILRYALYDNFFEKRAAYTNLINHHKPL